MTLKIPNVGEAKLLAMMLGKDAVDVYQLRLFSNNVTPGETDTASSYTQVTGSGYAAIDLTAASWTITEGAPTQATYPQQSFTFTASFGNVYGYYVVGKNTGVLLWAERFTDGPYNVTQNGDTIRVTPKFTYQDTGD